MRHIIRRLFPHLDQNPEDEQQGYALDAELMASLQKLADRQQLPVEEVAETLLSQAIQDRKIAESRLEPWRKLSPRLQQITALICLGYTNHEIAHRLKISPETVKTHVRVILSRYDVHSKVALREILASWDFSSWQ